jgi:EmrB/QacA subfamily drug resistance transporter
MSRKWWTLAAVSIATFMLLLDITVVNTALPSIQEDLGGTFADLQWVVDAYTLALAAVVLAAGSLADRVGRRRTFVVGLAIFSVASLAIALSPSTGFLIAARGVQGIGGAIMFALSLALIAQEFEAGRARATAMGVYGATIGVAVAVGPLVGGALTDSLGWESVFYLNLPIGIAAIAMTLARVRESRDPDADRIDWPGLVTFSTALFMLVLALIRGNADGWGATHIVALLAGSVVLLGAFVVIEMRSKAPMLPLRLFRNRAFTGVQIAAFAISSSLFALFLYLTLYLQGYLGNSPLDAGLKYLPVTLATFFVSAGAASLVARAPARVLMGAGLGLVGIGILLIGGREAADGWTALLPGFAIAGAGTGLVNVVIADVAVSVVPKERSGMASGINDTFRQVGVSVGIAAWGALFLGRGAEKVETLAAGTPAASGERPRELVEAVSSGQLDQALAAVPAPAQDTVALAAREGFLAGFNEIALAGGIVAIIGAIAALLLVRESDIERDAMQPEPVAEPQPDYGRVPAPEPAPA